MKLAQYKLSLPWHVLAVLVMAYVNIALAADFYVPRYQSPKQSSHSCLAASCIGLWFLTGISTLLVLLPRTGNLSRVKWCRSFGQMNIPVRWLIVAVSALALHGVEELLAKMAS
jgi:hypothetical protein